VSGRLKIMGGGGSGRQGQGVSFSNRQPKKKEKVPFVYLGFRAQTIFLFYYIFLSPKKAKTLFFVFFFLKFQGRAFHGVSLMLLQFPESWLLTPLSNSLFICR